LIAAAIGMELNKLFNPLAEIVPGSFSNALNLFRVGKKVFLRTLGVNREM
jgi:hypothetical protein